MPSTKTRVSRSIAEAAPTISRKRKVRNDIGQLRRLGYMDPNQDRRGPRVHCSTFELSPTRSSQKVTLSAARTRPRTALLQRVARRQPSWGSCSTRTRETWAVSMDRNISFRRSRGPSSVLALYVLSLKPLPGAAISSTIRQRVEPAHQVQGNYRDGWSFRFSLLLGKRVA